MAWKNQKPPSGIPAGGEGYGGPAKGASTSRFDAQNQPSTEAKMIGREVAAEVRARIAARRFEIVDKMIHTALHGEAAQSNQAGIFLINQIAGTPAQSVDLTSDGGPLTVVVRRLVDKGEDA